MLAWIWITNANCLIYAWHLAPLRLRSWYIAYCLFDMVMWYHLFLFFSFSGHLFTLFLGHLNQINTLFPFLRLTAFLFYYLPQVHLLIFLFSSENWKKKKIQNKVKWSVSTVQSGNAKETLSGWRCCKQNCYQLK